MRTFGSTTGSSTVISTADVAGKGPEPSRNPASPRPAAAASSVKPGAPALRSSTSTSPRMAASTTISIRRSTSSLADAGLAQNGHHRAPAREGGLEEVQPHEGGEQVDPGVDEPAEGERGDDERPGDGAQRFVDVHAGS